MQSFVSQSKCLIPSLVAKFVNKVSKSAAEGTSTKMLNVDVFAHFSIALPIFWVIATLDQSEQKFQLSNFGAKVLGTTLTFLRESFGQDKNW